MERQIIIVTRDSQFRDALERVCSGQGCRVETADTVATALATAVRMPVCILIADASIQDPNDSEGLTAAIHGQYPDAICFLIVNEQSVVVLSPADDEPWLRFVHKPIPMLRFAADVVDAIAESTAGD